jgi:hypothetical protein
VTLRVPSGLRRTIEREARRRRRTKSDLLREIVENALAGREGGLDPAEEARRQSLLVSTRRSEKETLAFIERFADRRGWR